MTWRSVCDAWVDELTDNVAGLADAKTHRYASWSPEALFAQAGERHLAVWPEGEAETFQSFVTDGGQLAEQEYVVLVWEDAGSENARLMDDEDANGDWLDLHEAVRARFFVAANVRLGNAAIMRTRVVGGSFSAVAGVRAMELRFRVQLPFSMA